MVVALGRKSNLVSTFLQVMLVASGILLGLGDADAAAAASGNEWTTAMGTVEGTRYSSLNQINKDNASALTKQFSVATGVPKGHQGQPLVVNINGAPRMFVVTPYPNRLIALNATTGAILWTYKPSIKPYSQGVACCDVVNRGAAYSSGRVVYTLLDGSVVAVDANSGRQLWKVTVGTVTMGETLTGAPIIVKDKYVIVGNAGGELGIRGWVAALSLSTGKLVWKGFNTGPDSDVKIKSGYTDNPYAKDRGPNLGSTSWTPPANPPRGTTSTTNIWMQGGSTVWGWFTYDPELNLLYYGTANPGVWNPDQRLGANQWSASIFARDPDTGDVKWVYQLTPHDGWDYDAMNEVTVIPDPADVTSSRGKVLMHFNKNGFAYMLDAATGRVISAPPFVHTTWSSGVDVATGIPAVNPGMLPRENNITGNICPSPLGGKEFSPAAYSDSTGLFYVPGINFCTALEPLKAAYIPSTPYIGAELAFSPDFDTSTAPAAPTASFGPYSGRTMGELIAWNPSSGNKLWSVGEAAPLWGGVLATAGDVVFYGTLDKHFKALNAIDGTVLFDVELECGIVSNPITYMGSDGFQRVAIYTGIGWLPGAFAPGGACPATGDAAAADPALTGRLHVFKLPSLPSPR